MGRSPCCVKEGLNRGAWTKYEDKILTEYIKVHGEGRWRNVPKRAGLKRCGKSCRLRWLNYLRPDIKRGNISPDEEELIIRLHKLLGNRWSLIAGRLPGRTDNEIKNYWKTNLGKRIQKEQKTSNEIFPSETVSPSPPKMGSHVFKVKAFKCSKAIVNPNCYTGDSNEKNMGEETQSESLIRSIETNNSEIDAQYFKMDYFDNGDNQVFNFCEFSPLVFSEEERVQDFIVTNNGEASELNNNNNNILSPFTSFFDSGWLWLEDN